MVSQAEGGPDTEDNAAPLCPSCHETYGSNSQKRKLVRECRDLWNELCEKQSMSGLSYLTEIADVLKTLSTKEDIDRLAVRVGSREITEQGSSSFPLDPDDYSFVRPEFIHPLIVQHLLGWISDRGEPVVAIDLSSANHSNQFYGDFTTTERDGRIWAHWHESTPDPYSFEYSHIATSASGVQMVECWNNMGSGGSGRFASVGLFSLSYDRALSHAGGKIGTRDRILLKVLGQIGLGDRYFGRVTYENGFLVIAPDENQFLKEQSVGRRLPIR